MDQNGARWPYQWIELIQLLAAKLFCQPTLLTELGFSDNDIGWHCYQSQSSVQTTMQLSNVIGFALNWPAHAASIRVTS